jgi:hypothetical protein
MKMENGLKNLITKIKRFFKIVEKKYPYKFPSLQKVKTMNIISNTLRDMKLNSPLQYQPGVNRE